MKVLRMADRGGGPLTWLIWWCPGCHVEHSIPVGGPFPFRVDEKFTGMWGWNGSQSLPSIEPSVFVNRGRHGSMPACHFYIAAGKILFQADSSHELAGQTVEMAG